MKFDADSKCDQKYCDYEGDRERSNAWFAVAEALGEIMPEWCCQGGTGKENAIAAIRKLHAEAKERKLKDCGEQWHVSAHAWDMGVTDAHRAVRALYPATQQAGIGWPSYIQWQQGAPTSSPSWAAIGIIDCWQYTTLFVEDKETGTKFGAVPKEYDAVFSIFMDDLLAAHKATKRPRIYIAGPMSGLPDLNFPAFHAEAARLRALGYDVVNPAELNIDNQGDWASCMKADITQLMTCDGIALLPGWMLSRGASLEHQIAYDLGMDIYERPITEVVL